MGLTLDERFVAKISAHRSVRKMDAARTVRAVAGGAIRSQGRFFGADRLPAQILAGLEDRLAVGGCVIWMTASKREEQGGEGEKLLHMGIFLPTSPGSHPRRQITRVMQELRKGAGIREKSERDGNQRPPRQILEYHG